MSADEPDEFTARRLRAEAEAEGESEYTSGEWQCAKCNHQWIGVAPAGVIMGECPRCNGVFGHPRATVLREGYTLMCQCGNDLFRVHAVDGVYCIMCGTTQKDY